MTVIADTILIEIDVRNSLIIKTACAPLHGYSYERIAFNFSRSGKVISTARLQTKINHHAARRAGRRRRLLLRRPKILYFACAAAGDNRDANSAGYTFDEINFVAFLSAIAANPI